MNRKLGRTLVLFPGSLGDVICALPAFSSLRCSSTEKLVIATRGEAFELCNSFLVSDEVIFLESAVFSQLFLNPQQIALPAHFLQFFSAFSTIISWYGHERSEVRENLLRFSSADVKTFAFFTGQKDCHAASYYLSCIAKEEVPNSPSLAMYEEVPCGGNTLWRKFHKDALAPVLFIHPGSGGKRKRWDPEGFRQVGKWWQERRNGQVVILLGPAEKKELLQWQSIGEIAAELSLVHVAILLSRADLYLGNDSGVSHLAGAVGARGLVLFGPTLPQQWRPLGEDISVVRNSIYRTVFPDQEGISLDEIPVEEVIKQLTFVGK